ncbi:TPA: hypothetical protein BOS_12694 [Bos taurus]|nr:TPA: hypothetical protein BOS_12694 [Bos taurus]
MHSRAMEDGWLNSLGGRHGSRPARNCTPHFRDWPPPPPPLAPKRDLPSKPSQAGPRCLPPQPTRGLLRLLTVRPKMSMRSGGDEARSRSRSRRDTAVLVERERDRDSRRRFRLLSRDLERFRTRSLSRERDRDRLRFLLCLLLLVCLERDELRLRDRPILPGDAVTNRWLRALHVPGYPRLRLRTRADRSVEAEGKKAGQRADSLVSL